MIERNNAIMLLTMLTRHKLISSFWLRLNAVNEQVTITQFLFYVRTSVPRVCRSSASLALDLLPCGEKNTGFNLPTSLCNDSFSTLKVSYRVVKAAEKTDSTGIAASLYATIFCTSRKVVRISHSAFSPSDCIRWESHTSPADQSRKSWESHICSAGPLSLRSSPLETLSGFKWANSSNWTSAASSVLHASDIFVTRDLQRLKEASLSWHVINYQTAARFWPQIERGITTLSFTVAILYGHEPAHHSEIPSISNYWL